jgi:hypothetical protein
MSVYLKDVSIGSTLLGERIDNAPYLAPAEGVLGRRDSRAREYESPC